MKQLKFILLSVFTFLFSSNVISQNLIELEQRIIELEKKTSPIALVHPGNMCTPVGDNAKNSQCLELGPNGAKNNCDEKIVISCPLVIEPNMRASPKYNKVYISVYGSEMPKVRARVIWHNVFSWEWGECDWAESQTFSAGSIFAPLCTGPTSFVYALEVELPSSNTWVYHYTPLPINRSRYD